MLQAVRHEWQAWSAIARLTLHWRAHLGNNLFSWFLGSMALIAPIVTSALTGRWAYGVGMGAGLSLLILAILWWSLLLYSVLIQNHATGKLLPRLRKRTVGVILFAGLACTFALTALFALAGVAPLAAFASIATVFAALALFIAWPAIPIGTFVLLFAALLYDRHALRHLFRDTPGEAWILAAALSAPLMMYLALSRLFRVAASVDLHFMREKRTQVKKLDLLFHLGAGKRLQRAASKAGFGQLLLHGLGPRMKLPLLFALAPVPLFGIPLVLLGPGASAELRTLLRELMFIFSSMTLITISSSVPLAIARTKEEQALLRLCGRAPPPSQLNAVLGSTLVREFLRLWIVWTVSVSVFAWAGGLSVDNLLCLLPAFSLPLLNGCVVLRDYARASAVRTRMGDMVLMLACLLGSMFLGMVALLGKLDVAFSLTGGVLVLIASVVLYRVRWISMVNARPALPAGRID